MHVTVPQIYGIDNARAYSLRAFFGGKLAMDSSPGGPMLPRNSGKLPNMNDARVIKDEDLFLGGGEPRAVLMHGMVSESAATTHCLGSAATVPQCCASAAQTGTVSAAAVRHCVLTFHSVKVVSSVPCAPHSLAVFLIRLPKQRKPGRGVSPQPVRPRAQPALRRPGCQVPLLGRREAVPGRTPLRHCPHPGRSRRSRSVP